MLVKNPAYNTTDLSTCVDSSMDIKTRRVAPLITHPLPAHFNTMHSRLARQDRNLCLGGTAYLASPAKLL